MNIINSLLLYNPLEVLTLFLFCNIFTKYKFGVKNIKDLYILGAINLLVQHSSRMFNDDLLIFIIDSGVSLLIIPVILATYSLFVLKITNLKLKICMLSMILNYFVCSVFVKISNIVFISSYNSRGFTDNNVEFIANISVRIIILVIILIIRSLFKRYEFKTQRNCKKDGRQIHRTGIYNNEYLSARTTKED